ncbi:hypothetical protein L1049_016861 [Liquidambar formosana]|uniref:F-box associated beta-propeller type 1 domain-containing protein n=1 Tax=Liquidambar formosana TaxID=63359 RepID=A0AAP0S057_LIQFO
MAKFPKLRDGLDFVLGLSYDSSIDDYKVVRLIHFTHSRRFIRTRGDVFTLKTNAWRRIDEIHPSAFMFKKTGTFQNGSLHWLVDRRNGEDKFKSIVSFDLATEKFQEVVPLPDYDVETFSIEGFRDLGGFLAMIFGYADYFEVWVMKEYGVKTSWTKLVPYPWEEAPPHMDWFSPLCFSKSDEVLMDVDGSELLMYSLKVNTFMKLLIYGESWERFDSVIYAESLVSLNGNDGTDKQRRG